MAATATLRSADDLADAGLIDPSQALVLEAVSDRYAIAIPPALAKLIDRNDPNDPIARQYVPSPEELHTTAEELADPIGDLAFSPVEGIVHRYPDRVLLKPLHVCPVYCRFCFRREMVGPEGLGTLSSEALDSAFAYIAAHPEIWEVILTGGDPLMLAPRRLASILAALDAIHHVKIVRVHTRVPVVTPEAVDEAMVRALSASSKTVYIGVHANHPREMTDAARGACARLADAGLPLLSQTVLLRGVNDDPAVLADLMRAFVESRVRPYYLHHPDLAPGTARFRLTIAEGQAIMRALRGRVSGLCLPTYVLDIPGGHGKSPVGPNYVNGGEVEDFRGQAHAYPPE
ncbi:lysine-2,3-aminomutase-like protein [Terrihabitans rhizophilus]|uniref:Lysine-2,3-aminomutase-like protein n=1 Tax=Terrihabitans rhizophilus TaxID=3092662 RepID=A0ABU4RVV4_9HYPH|nr:lysine-2,3-aminomutase-like protein [Terrihabitans sp. PJ23]MDX6807001.1 lysine-2,3-aminomutase-like protein [Terrihabitans sp. PJ23]